jgi:methionine biosynthesis protein MetW
MQSPDQSTGGLVTAKVDPLRYQFRPTEPYEVGSRLMRLLPRGQRVLDVGCGVGQLMHYLRDEHGCDVVGIEPDPDRAEHGRGLGLTVHTAVFEEAPLDRLGKFDVILFCDVLEHMVNPGSALETAARLLKPGGFVIASIPNVAHWSVRFDLLLGRFDYYAYGIRDATHLRWFTRKTVRQMFTSTGYELQAMLYTAGTGLPEYAQRFPWRWTPRFIRNPFIRLASWLWPTLFGCQFVVKAVPARKSDLPARVAA